MHGESDSALRSDRPPAEGDRGTDLIDTRLLDALLTEGDQPMTDRAVLVDIDGTLALRTGNRSPFDWSRVGEDDPNPPVIELVRIIHAAGAHRIILMSGRDESCRTQTEMWLDAQAVPFQELHMRPEKDNRKDSIVKEELYRRHVEGRYAVSFVVDDRNQVVTMWRSLGLSCFQVAEGNF